MKQILFNIYDLNWKFIGAVWSSDSTPLFQLKNVGDYTHCKYKGKVLFENKYETEIDLEAAYIKRME